MIRFIAYLGVVILLSLTWMITVDRIEFNIRRDNRIYTQGKYDRAFDQLDIGLIKLEKSLGYYTERSTN